jgi:mannitol/fructose-specific phosphotransferase system IIA component (Ntr-type)
MLILKSSRIKLTDYSEREASTGFGRKIAVPPGKSKTVNELSLAIGRSEK